MAVVKRGQENALMNTASVAMNATSETIGSFLSFLRATSSEYRMAEQTEREADDLTQDILHFIEIERPRRSARTKAVVMLEKARNDRRLAKDTQRVAAPVIQWMSENPIIVKSLERLLGDVRKGEKAIQGRLYAPRTPEFQSFIAENQKGMEKEGE